MWSAQEGHAEVARLLLQRGAIATRDNVCAWMRGHKQGSLHGAFLGYESGGIVL